MTKTTMETIKIAELYKVTDTSKYLSLLEEVKENNWENVPAIVVLENNTGYYAITGSHRYAVAEELEIDIPVELYNESEIEDIKDRDDVDAEGLMALEEY